MKKILIVYGSVGLGHKVVSENIAAALQNYPDIEIKMLDVLELYKGWLTEGSKRIYEWIIKYIPRLWGFFYTNRIFQKLTLPLRFTLASFKTRKIKDYLAQEKPDIVLTAHPNATALFAYLKKTGEYQGPLVTTFSDYHFQPYWVFPFVDRYLVMTSEQKDEVVKRGFSPEQVIVTGLPGDSAFLKDYKEGEIFRELKLSHTKPVVLVMGGSRGWGIRLEDIKSLLNSKFDIEIATVTGNNPELLATLNSLAKKESNLKVFGEWSNEQIAKLFAGAKLLVTKPGGLTITQGLLRSLPMIFINPLPTMEEMNLQYLVGKGAAVYAKDSRELVSWVERLLQDRKLYQEFKDNAKKLSQPDAPKRAAQEIIDMLDRQY